MCGRVRDARQVRRHHTLPAYAPSPRSMMNRCGCGKIPPPLPPSSTNSTWRPNSAILVATATLLVVCFAARDVIPYASGTGYDGGRYATWAKVLSLGRLVHAAQDRLNGKVPTTHGDEVLDSFYAHRILPSIAVYYALGAIHAERSTDNVILGFTWLNIALLLVTALCLLKSADELRVSTNGKCIAMVGLIVSYGNLKMPLYYPTLTDTASLAAGAASMLFYLRRRTWPLAFTTLAGAFIWPTLIWFNLPMLMFPRASSGDTESASRGIDGLVAAAIAIAMVLWIEYLFASGFELRWTPVQPIVSLRHASIAVAGGYTFFALWQLLDMRAIWMHLRPTRLLPGVLAGVLVTVVSEILARLIAPLAPDFGLREFFGSFFTAALQPFTFFLAHVLYFGPILIFLIFAWRGMCSRIREFGPGAVAYFAAAVILSLRSESRQLINVLPFVLLLLAPFLEGVLASWPRWATFLGLTVICSKVWLPMDRTVVLPYLGALDWRDLYVSSRGPWIDHGAYLLQLALTVPVGVLFWYWWFRPVVRIPTAVRLMRTAYAVRR